MPKMDDIFKKRTCLTKAEIERYLTGKLSQDERFDIENHLLDCELCSAAVEGFGPNNDLIYSLPDEWTDEQARDLDLNNSFNQKGSFSINWYRIAAVFTGVVLFASVMYQYFNVTNNKKLFADAYSMLPPSESNTRSVETDSAADTEVSEAMTLYGKHEFPKAIELFEQRLKEFPKDNESYLYSGICYLELKDLTKAEENFKKARINSESFYPEATWYLALCYVRGGKMDQAKTLLQELTDSQNDYSLKAKELLIQLNQ